MYVFGCACPLVDTLTWLSSVATGLCPLPAALCPLGARRAVEFRWDGGSCWLPFSIPAYAMSHGVLFAVFWCMACPRRHGHHRHSFRVALATAETSSLLSSQHVATRREEALPSRAPDTARSYGTINVLSRACAFVSHAPGLQTACHCAICSARAV